MERLRAFEIFAGCTPEQLKERFGWEGTVELPGLGDVTPASMVAAVELAGCLDDACNDDELFEGLAHCMALYNMELVDKQLMKETICSIIDDLLRWGAEHDLQYINHQLAARPHAWN